MPASALDPMRDDAAGPTNRAASDRPDLGPGRSGGGALGTATEEAVRPRVAPAGAAAPKAAARAPRPRCRLTNRWVDALIVVAMLGAAAIIVLSVAGIGEEGSDDDSRSASAPEGSGAADERDGAAAGGTQVDEEREGDGGEPMAGAEMELGRPRTFFSAYRIAIPSNWNTTRHESFVQFVCDDRSADVRVYHERRGGRPTEMKDELRRFLEDEHPRADIGDFERTRIGGAEAASLTARFGGSVEVATLVAERPYLYLIVSRWEESTSDQDRAATMAVVRSFRPA